MKEITLFVILLIAGTNLNPLFSQTQIGEDIDGEAAGDRSGRLVSLSSDGNRVAIGARRNDGNGDDSGHVRVYELLGTNWSQVGEDINGEDSGDEFSRVCLSSDGNRIAIGANLNDGNGIDAGHVRVYDWNGTNWTQVGEDIDGEAAGDESGFSVSLSTNGNRIAIGARRNDGNGDDSGHVRVYEHIGIKWVQVGTDIDGEATGDESGYFLSLSSDGSKVAIGAIKNDGNGVDSGHARVYELIGTKWIQAGDDIDGEAEADMLGPVYLSADGNRIATGSVLNDGNGENSGHVRVYDWDGFAWIQAGKDIDGNAEYDLSGTAVSLSSDGSRLAIGAKLNDGNEENAGRVEIYDWDGEIWTQVSENINGESEGDGSGSYLSLSGDGKRVAIGAGNNDGNGENSGHVRVYENLSVVSTINQAKKASIKVFPNPTYGKITLIGAEYKSVSIMDNMGRIIWKTNQYSKNIDITNLPSGIYFIQINSNNELINRKIIKQ